MHVVLLLLLRYKLFFVQEFPSPRLHPTDPAQKAKDRLVVEVFGKMMGPFYKSFMAKTHEERVNTYKVNRHASLGNSVCPDHRSIPHFEFT